MSPSHGTISVIALLRVPVVFAYALLMGFGPAHALVETLPVASFALLARRPAARRLSRELSATLSLVFSSAVLVHLSGGYIELHFHVFVIVALVTLYQQWNPFLVAIAFVAVDSHDGLTVFTVLFPNDGDGLRGDLLTTGSWSFDGGWGAVSTM